MQKTRKHLILQYSFGRERFSDYKTNLRIDILKGQCEIQTFRTGNKTKAHKCLFSLFFYNRHKIVKIILGIVHNTGINSINTQKETYLLNLLDSSQPGR